MTTGRTDELQIELGLGLLDASVVDNLVSTLVLTPFIPYTPMVK
jgi:hypothetical protein